MRNKYTVVSHKVLSAEAEPLTVPAARAYIRYTDTDKNHIFKDEITSARSRIENFCDITLRPATRVMNIGLQGYGYMEEASLCPGYGIDLYRGPVKEIIKVEKSNADFTYSEVPSATGVDTPWVVNDNRFVVTKTIEEINILNPVSIRITYTTGFDDIPEDLLRAWKEIVSCGFHNAEGIKTDYKMKSGFPLRVAHILQHYRNAFYEL